MLLGASLLAYFFLLPLELEHFATSLIAATFSFSNFYFAHALEDYFSPVGADSPLLHTWSLAIEEQFYVFLPLLILVAHRVWRRGLWLILSTAALVSLAVSIWYATSGRADGFFLPQVRAWELLVGTLVASPALPTLRGAIWREGAALLGLALIIFTIAGPNGTADFPGYIALIPCLGTALVILANRSGETLLTSICARKPVLFVGRISYSLYLWHWPILCFLLLSERFPTEADKTGAKLGAVALALVVATLSWRYVETPLRSGPRRPPRHLLFAGAGVVATVLALVGLGAEALRGLPQRFPPEAVEAANWMHFSAGQSDLFRYCFITEKTDRTEGVAMALQTDHCLDRDEHRPNYLVIGDSYSKNIWYGLHQVFDRINLMEATGAGCKPLIAPSGSPFCRNLMSFLFSKYLPTHKPDRLVIMALWTESDRENVRQILDWANHNGIRVILLGPLIRYDETLPRLLAFSLRYHDARLVTAHRLSQETLDADLGEIAREEGAQYISLLALLCPNSICETDVPPGIPLEFDTGHLTKAGSLHLAQRLKATGAFPAQYSSAP